MRPNADLIPPNTKETIDIYVTRGCECGSFLTCVLGNDLFGAMGKADSINLAALPHTCAYIFNRIPWEAWGSLGKIREWKNKKRKE